MDEQPIPNKELGILQLFLPSIGQFHFIIRAMWSPSQCILEKKQSNKKFNSKFDKWERIYNFDGKEFHSESKPVLGYYFPNYIKQVCQAIALHITNISLNELKVDRMNLDFKVDQENVVWLTVCSKMRLLECNKNNNYIKNSDFQMIMKSSCQIDQNVISIDQPLQFRKQIFCYKCNKNFTPQNIFEISFEQIIKSHNQYHDNNFYFQQNKELESKQDEYSNKKKQYMQKIPNIYKVGLAKYQVKNENDKFNIINSMPSIPPLLKSFMPSLTLKEYQTQKCNPAFRSQKLTVCSDCFLQITDMLVNLKDVKVGSDNRSIPHNPNTQEQTIRNINFQKTVMHLRPELSKNIRLIHNMIIPKEKKKLQLNLTEETPRHECKESIKSASHAIQTISRFYPSQVFNSNSLASKILNPLDLKSPYQYKTENYQMPTQSLSKTKNLKFIYSLRSERELNKQIQVKCQLARNLVFQKKGSSKISSSTASNRSNWNNSTSCQTIQNDNEPSIFNNDNQKFEIKKNKHLLHLRAHQKKFILKLAKKSYMEFYKNLK